MISQYFGKCVSIPKLREYAKTDKSGTNLFGMIKAGEKIGLNLNCVQANSVEELQNIEYPSIVNIINQQGYHHFVVLDKIKGDNVYVVDPAKGKYKMSSKYFEKIRYHFIVKYSIFIFITDNSTLRPFSSFPQVISTSNKTWILNPEPFSSTVYSVLFIAFLC